MKIPTNKPSSTAALTRGKNTLAIKLAHAALALSTVIALAGTATAQTGYSARISNHDKVSSKNTPIAKASDILRQDRANYHRFKKRDNEDQNDTRLNTSAKRAAATFSMSSSTENAITSGNPLVSVKYQNGSFQVSVVSGSSTQQPSGDDQADQSFKAADAELNRTYKLLQSHLQSAQQKKDLTKAQKAWIAFRDSNAAFRAGVTSGGGSAYSMDYLANLTELTQQRNKQLKALLP